MSFLSQTAEGAVKDAVLKGASLEGKVVLITGASSGIGEESARVLAQAGMTVVLAVRNVKKGEDVVRGFGEVRGKCVVMQLDLASFASVRAFADNFLKTGMPLDVLMLNGGVYVDRFTRTKDGLEETFQVHVVAHYLLVELLKNRLVETPKSRLVIVSSTGHTMGKLRFPSSDDKLGFMCDSEADFNATSSTLPGFQAYTQAKLAQVVLGKLWATELNPRGVGVFSLHPGGVYTAIWPWYIAPLMRLVMINVRQGAATQTALAVSPKLDGHGYEYWQPTLFGAPAHVPYAHASQVDDVKVQERLVAVIRRMLAGAGAAL